MMLLGNFSCLAGALIPILSFQSEYVNGCPEVVNCKFHKVNYCDKLGYLGYPQTSG